MDEPVCVPEEHLSEPRDCHSSVPGLTAGPLKQSDVPRLFELFKTYFEEVFWPDKESNVSLDGKKLSDSEKQLLIHVQEGASIDGVYLDDEMVGFFIYHFIYDCILMVHAIYLVPKLRNSGAAWDIVKSIGAVKKIFFQNRTITNPDKRRGKIIHQNDDHIVYEKDVIWAE